MDKCFIYDFCGNEIVEMYMTVRHKTGEEFTLNCGYTGKETHYVFLGKIEK